MNIAHTNTRGEATNMINTALDAATLEAGLWRAGIIKTSDDGCIIMESDPNKNPFINYPMGQDNAVIRVYLPDVKNKWQTRSIQAFANQFLYGKEYIPQRHMTTTCGNPFCISEDHIKYRVSDEEYYSRKKALDTSLKAMKTSNNAETKLRDYQAVMRLSVEGLTSSEISHQMGISKSTVDTYRAEMLTDLLGDDYDWNDFNRIRDIADGMRYAEEKRDDAKTALKRLFKIA
jgi:hypothetical protein